MRASHAPPRRRLDPASRGAIARAVFQLVWFALFASVPVMLHLGGAGQGAVVFGSYCLFAALLNVLAALRRRERLGAASLNGYDEALVFAAAALLASFLSRWG